MKKTLEWGRTPWDEMNREELLREVERMYSALLSVNSALKLTRFNEEGNPFFGTSGTGGRALEKARQILEPLHAQYEEGDGELYRAYFRYADDLLFDRSTGYRIGAGWAVCPECGVMIGESMDGKSKIGESCGTVFPTNDKCPGVMRALSWDDLKPNPEGS